MVQIIPFIKLIQENFIGLNNVSFGFFSGIFKEKKQYLYFKKSQPNSTINLQKTVNTLNKIILGF